jgi:hypothetical protein
LFKGKVQQKWGKLTNDDQDVIERRGAGMSASARSPGRGLKIMDAAVGTL